MVHFIALYRIDRDKTEKDLEEMLRLTRTLLHKTDEAHNLRSGRSIDPESDFGFFISADFSSRDRYEMFRDDPGFIRFENEVVDPHTLEAKEFLYETEPGKDPRYS